VNAVVHDDRVYLRRYLAPLQKFLTRADVTDIYINKPGEVWIETLGGTTEFHEDNALDAATLDRLSRQVAALTHQGISREHPLLAANLPDGARIQIISPPATRGPLAIAIRKHVVSNLKLEDYADAGAFDEVISDASRHRVDADTLLANLRARGDISGLLRSAVQQRRNILISGGTATGKTTFLNALIREIAPDERIILIEDTPELEMRHANAIGLVAARSPLGEAIANSDELLNASLRMRPDRIILGELRGPEAFTFLRAVNTGHPGSMTTIHADSPERAVEQLALLVLQTGTRLDRQSVLEYVNATIDVFVQVARAGGRRYVSEIALRAPVGV
jgi:type IV secretion system protein VirB11